MKKIICGIFLLLPLMSLASEEKESYEAKLKIEIINTQSGQSVFVDVDPSNLRKYATFRNISQRGYRAEFGSPEMASAFKKIIQFVDEDAQKLEAYDLADLVTLVHQYGISELGVTIAESLCDEVYEKLNKKSSSPILLDSMSPEQFRHFFQKIKLAQRREALWFQKIQIALRDYTAYLVYHKDTRANGLTDIDLNILARCHGIEQKYHRDQKKRLAQEEFQQGVDDIVAHVKAGIEQAYHAGKLTDEVPVFEFAANQKYARAAVDALARDLINFEIKLNICAWSHESDLSSKEDWPCSLGACCATACGWGVCLACSPVEVFTCNYLFFFDNCGNGDGQPKFWSTQIGGLVRHGIYKIGSCGRRWIIVKPKTGIPIPPKIEMDMFRSFSEV